MESFLPAAITGTIQSIRPFSENGGMCTQLMAMLRTENGFVNVMISQETYVAGQVRLRRGMRAVFFYDGNAPMPLIYPPQYHALFIAVPQMNEQVVVSYFDDNLSAVTESLQLRISPQTQVVAANGQQYACPLENRLLMVFYTAATRSLPPQTTPRRVIVL